MVLVFVFHFERCWSEDALPWCNQCAHFGRLRKEKEGYLFLDFLCFCWWLLAFGGFWLLAFVSLLAFGGFWLLGFVSLLAFDGFWWLLWLFWLPLLQSGAARKERRKEGRKHVHGFEGIVFFKIFFYPDAVLGGSTNSPSFQPAFALKHSYVLPNPAPVESIYLPLYTWAGQKREFIHSFIHSFIPSFIPSFMPSFLPSFLHSFIHSFIPSLYFVFMAEEALRRPRAPSHFLI